MSMEQLSNTVQAAGAAAGVGPEAALHWLFGVVMAGISGVGGWVLKQVSSHTVQIAELKETCARLDERTLTTKQTVESMDGKLDRVLENLAKR
jgi:hypothetical protein